MSTHRQLADGARDFRNSTVQGFRIGEFVPGLRPRRWNAKCVRCAVAQTVAHADLLHGQPRCKNSGCGREHVAELAAETLTKMRRREREQAEHLERQRQELRAAAVETAKGQLAETTRKLGAEMRLRLQKGRDDGLARDPEADGLSLSEQDAQRYNGEQLKIFRTERPDAYLSDVNIDALGAYFERQGIRLVSAKTLAAAYDRLSEYGLLEQRPAPVAKPTASVKPSPAKQPEPEPISPQAYPGFDETTGQPRVYSEFEVSRMSGEQFRRLCMKKADTTFHYQALY